MHLQTERLRCAALCFVIVVHCRCTTTCRYKDVAHSQLAAVLQCLLLQRPMPRILLLLLLLLLKHLLE
jgi:hypothetical protein